MLIKSPMKKKKIRRNKRKRSTDKKKRSNLKDSAKSSGASHGKRVKPKGNHRRISLPKVKPWKIILGAAIIGALGVMYLNHVFATQELLREVQQMERKYNQAKRANNDYRLTFDRMIGPADIYKKAKSNGFINGGPAEKVLEVEK